MSWDYDGVDTLTSLLVSDSDLYDGETSFTVTVLDYSDFKDTATFYRSKGERYEPQIGYWSPFAWVIGSEFPQWHAARSNHFSRTQRLLNVLSQPLWEFDQIVQYERRNKYISTADMFQPDTAFRVPVTVEWHDENRNAGRPRNLLHNPDFSIPGLARYGMPWMWTNHMSGSTGVVEHYSANSLYGSGCIRIFTENGQIGYLRQNNPKTLGVNDSVTASAWVLVPSTENIADEEETKRALVLTVLYADGTTDTERTALPSGTDGSWRRISCTLTPTQRVANVDFMIVVENDLARDYEIFVDACQVELGKAPTSFERMLVEMPTWMEQYGRQTPWFLEALGAGVTRTVDHSGDDEISYTEYSRVRLWPTGDQYDWWLNALPTRVETPVVGGDDLEGTVKTRYGFYADTEDRSRRACVFQVSSDQTKIEWVVEETPIDVVFSYQIADHWMDQGREDEYGIPGEEDDTYSIVIEALTVHKDMLWVVGLETWNFTTKRVLKVLRPFQRADVLADDNQPNFLETIQDYDLGLTSGSVSAIAFADGDDTQLLMTIDSTEYVAQLYYDYAFFDREVVTSTLLRHNYQGQELVMR